MKTKQAKLARMLAATVAGLETAIVVYAVTRVLQTLLVAEPNPALVITSAHHGYFWRAWIAAYAGGFAAIAIGLLARDTQALAIARTTLRALPWTAAIAVAQALLVP